jgi:hypothetical protein
MQEIDEIGNVHDRIIQMVEHFGKGNKAAFGRVANIQSGVLAGIIGGRKNKPSFEVLQKILTGYPTVNPTWLLFGRGEMLIDQKVPTYEETHPHRVQPDGTLKEKNTPGAFLPARDFTHEKKRYDQYYQRMARHERAVTVLRALGEYLTKTDTSPELRGILDMLPDALAQPMSPDDEDSLWDAEHERRMDEYHADQQAEWERQRQERGGKQEGQQ